MIAMWRSGPAIQAELGGLTCTANRLQKSKTFLLSSKWSWTVLVMLNKRKRSSRTNRWIMSRM
uniref:Uncharacterized protein n=1 Tax=Arundo donax TaxID=35708 RepID=A0A0A9F177_ARUDO